MDQGLDGMLGTAMFTVTFSAVESALISVGTGYEGDGVTFSNGEFRDAIRDTFVLNVVPEPGTALLMGLGLALLSSSRSVRRMARGWRPFESQIKTGVALIRIAFFVACFCAAPGMAGAQTVAMSGEYGESSGRTINLPINPPLIPCTNVRNARCHQGSITRGGGPQPDLLVEPSRGVGVAGAGVVVMPGGLSVGDPFTIPPEVFKQEANGVANVTPFVNNVAIVQVNTTITAVMPAAARAVNAPANTRMFETNAWNQPGNGMTGRLAANTTPISFATQTVHDITLRYTAGPNAFGGTMANLLDGEGRLYLTGPTIGSPANPLTGPWIGTIMLGDGIVGNPQTANGAGWGYTRMFSQASGVVRSQGGISSACTQANPPGPVGCGLVTKIDGDTIFTIPSATGTQFMFAYTTGTVSVKQSFTAGGGFSIATLTAMGYDTTSGTGTTAVRNVGLVAGSYTRRTAGGGTLSGQEIIGVNLRFTPEPVASFGLLGGLGMLGVLARRRAGPSR